MSDLILPADLSENKVLKKNLEAFFKRYPHERSRLETPLSEPIENREAVRIELPPCSSVPPMRILLLAGMGSPLTICDLLNNPVILKETFQIMMVENNLDNLRYVFQHVGMEQIINYPKLHWFLLENPESFKAKLFPLLQREETSAMCRSVSILDMHTNETEEIQTFYKALPLLYDEICQHVLHNFGRISDSLDGVRATLLNGDVILDSPGIEDLEEKFKGTPALIVGAGPSLDQEIEKLRENDKKFVIIAVDAALKPLLKANIRVDYVTTIERSNDYQKPFFEGLEHGLDCELVAYPFAHPAIFPLFPGRIRLCYRNYSYFAYFEKSWPKKILKSGGSTAHLAIRLAAFMGCEEIYLIGIDSCYEEKEGLFRSHCSNTGHPNWGSFIPINDFSEKRKHLPPMEALSNNGKSSVTNLTYYQWIKEYAQELADFAGKASITNCSAMGLKIEGVPFQPFSEVVSKLRPRENTQKPVYPKVSFLRSFDHKEILKNFEAWLLMIEDGLGECVELKAQNPSFDMKRYEALLYVYSFRMVADALFVSFVIQCCAREFFEIENSWWKLNRDWDKDLFQKIQLIYEKLTLFKEVLQEVVQIIKEGTNGREIYQSTDYRLAQLEAKGESNEGGRDEPSGGGGSSQEPAGSGDESLTQSN